MYVLYIKIMSIFFFETKVKYVMGLPWWLSSTESACKCRRCRFNPWVRKIPWRRRWQPTVVFLPGKSHGQRSRAGYIQAIGSQKNRHDLVTKQQQQSPCVFLSTELPNVESTIRFLSPAPYPSHFSTPCWAGVDDF